VAARYQGSPGGKIISEGKRKEESFGTYINILTILFLI
jgi:hypothetical protein